MTGTASIGLDALLARFDGDRQITAALLATFAEELPADIVATE